MMAKLNTIDQYHAKLAEAKAIAQDAANDLRGRAKELVAELQAIGDAYQDLTGDPLPELGSRDGRSRRGNQPRKKGGRNTRSTGRGGKRTSLKGQYAGKTIPEAVLAVLGKSKQGLGPTEIAEKIGGNRNSISVAMNGMVKDGLIKRAERGKYITA